MGPVEQSNNERGDNPSGTYIFCCLLVLSRIGRVAKGNNA